MRCQHGALRNEAGLLLQQSGGMIRACSEMTSTYRSMSLVATLRTCFGYILICCCLACRTEHCRNSWLYVWATQAFFIPFCDGESMYKFIYTYMCICVVAAYTKQNTTPKRVLEWSGFRIAEYTRDWKDTQEVDAPLDDDGARHTSRECTHTHLSHAHFSARNALTAHIRTSSSVSHTRMAKCHEKGVCTCVVSPHLAFSLLMIHQSLLRESLRDHSRLRLH